MVKTLGIVLLLVTCLLSGCSKESMLSASHERTSLMATMGTFCAVQMTDFDDALAQKIFQRFKQIEADLSTYDPSSYISHYNARTLQKGAYNADFDTLLTLSKAITHDTYGAYNPCLLPLSKCWGFQANRPIQPPDAKTLASILQSCSYDAPDHQLDFGAIAKGYALSQAANAVPLAKALISVGGSYYAHGDTYRIAIKDPYSSHADDTLLTTSLPAGYTLSTSGNYEKQVSIAGKRYTHIFDPRTGWPVTGIDAVTVLMPRDAARADAYATALMVMTASERTAWLKRHPEVAVLIVANHTLYTNPLMNSHIITDSIHSPCHPVEELQ